MMEGKEKRTNVKDNLKYLYTTNSLKFVIVPCNFCTFCKRVENGIKFMASL